MHTLESARRLLSAAEPAAAGSAILDALGFAPQLQTLDAETMRALQVPAGIDARISMGKGALRALVLRIPASLGLREALTRVAAGLSATVSHQLWLLVGLRDAPSELAVACWSGPRSPPRLQAMVCHSDNVLEGDAETLCAMEAAVTDSDMLTHARWIDILGRDSITRRFFGTLQQIIEALAESIQPHGTLSDRRDLALLQVSRLIFLGFLETKGWLDGDFGFLANRYAECVGGRGNYQRNVLNPLFFGTLNTRVRERSPRARSFGNVPFLNGGLFSRSHLEKRMRGCTFTDEAFGDLFGRLLCRYRLTPHEEAAGWSESAIDPEILGKAFEALMAASGRKTTGAFYTPQPLVEDLVAAALDAALNDGCDLPRLRELRILDPACGSGAFLVHALDRVTRLRIEAGDEVAAHAVRRDVLAGGIFGVDINPTAVWLCELRLWLAVVVDSAEENPMRVTPLPNLDRNIKVGDALAGGAFSLDVASNGSRLKVMRARYARATGARKKTLARALDREERRRADTVLKSEQRTQRAARAEMLRVLRSHDLFGERQSPDRATREWLTEARAKQRETAVRLRGLREGAALPFAFSVHFSDVAERAGFDLVIGNPPWVRVHHIPAAARERLKRDFSVYRGAAWAEGARAAGAGKGFAGQVDAASLFVERSWQLLRPGGILGLLVPCKLWRSLAGGGVRRLLLERTSIERVEDMTGAPSAFDAAVYPATVVARKNVAETRAPAFADVAVHRSGSVVRWRAQPSSLPLDAGAGSPWLLLPPEVRASFDRMSNAGIPLAGSVFGRPMLGVKTGLNAAFLVSAMSDRNGLTELADGEIETEFLRPVVRGERLTRWRADVNGERIVWPHDRNGAPLPALPPLVARRLARWRDQLTVRADLHAGAPWWSVFRTESANCERARVIWADFGITPRAVAIEPGDPVIPLNSCYAAACPAIADAHALAAILNSALAAAWLNCIAEPARGGYRRFLGWTVALLPTPRDWQHARSILAPLGERAARGEAVSDDDHLSAVLESYGMTGTQVEALLQWDSESRNAR